MTGNVYLVTDAKNMNLIVLCKNRDELSFWLSKFFEKGDNLTADIVFSFDRIYLEIRGYSRKIEVPVSLRLDIEKFPTEYYTVPFDVFESVVTKLAREYLGSIIELELKSLINELDLNIRLGKSFQKQEE